MTLSKDSQALDNAVNSVLGYAAVVCQNNPNTVRVVIGECLHKLERVGKIEGKMDSVVIPTVTVPKAKKK